MQIAIALQTSHSFVCEHCQKCCPPTSSISVLSCRKLVSNFVGTFETPIWRYWRFIFWWLHRSHIWYIPARNWAIWRKYSWYVWYACNNAKWSFFNFARLHACYFKNIGCIEYLRCSANLSNSTRAHCANDRMNNVHVYLDLFEFC